jgi:phage terminase large subunit
MIDVDIDRAVFNPVYIPLLTYNTPMQILFGGSGSGKSVFETERCVMDVMGGERNYLICRQVGRTLRGSVFTEVGKTISRWNVNKLFNINKSDMVITCTNGCQIIFTGLDDVEKLKSITPAKGVITDVWIEEATEVEKDSLKQLEKRLRGGSELTPKRISISFNPILQTHWIYQEYFSNIAWADDQREYHSDNLVILKTTYKDNKFLTKQDIARLESEKDSYYYNVYTLGNWGVLGNVIFTNYRVEDLTEFQDEFTNHRNGLDFGFSSDPAAMPVTHYDKMRKTIYIYDELYETGLTNDLLAEEVKRLIGNTRVTCDSAEPKSIAELRKYGVNAYSAKKGKDSVNHGIQWLQQQTIVIDPKCINARNEIMQYKWKEDRNGNAIREPVEHNNHIIDGLRYGYEEDSLMRNEVEVIDNPFF